MPIHLCIISGFYRRARPEVITQVMCVTEIIMHTLEILIQIPISEQLGFQHFAGDKEELWIFGTYSILI